MIGIISYSNPSHRFALITPLGRARAADVLASEIWFDIAGIEPLPGRTVEFDVGVNLDGHVEAVRIRSPAGASAEGSYPSTPAS